MKMWFRYLFGKISSTFFFFLISIFLIYTIVDLSIHGIRFFHGGSAWEIIAYYVYSFAGHLNFFLPLTLLLSSLRVLFDLNIHNEFIALQMAGLSQKKLLLPFFSLAIMLTLASYANQEWFSPLAQTRADTFLKANAKRPKKEEKPHLFSVALQDKSEIIYQEVQNNQLFDVFWIKNSKDIWHIKYLTIDPSVGKFVDHFQRNKNGQLEKIESFSERSFPDLYFDENICLETFIPFENRPLSTLFRQSMKESSEKQGVLSALHYKLASPWLLFILLILLAPFTMQFNRSVPTFFIGAISLLAFIGFMTLLEGMAILGENQVLPSYIAIWGPIFALIPPMFHKNLKTIFRKKYMLNLWLKYRNHS